MKKIVFFLILFTINVIGTVNMGPVIHMSEKNIMEGVHQLGTIAALPNGTFTIIFNNYTDSYFNDDQLCGALVAQDSTQTSAMILREYDSGDIQFRKMRINTSPDNYLLTFTEYDGDHDKIAHQWMSFENEQLWEKFYNYFTGIVHYKTFILPDKKIVTHWQKPGDAGWGATVYYEILQSNGQSWKLDIVSPCANNFKSSQVCYLSSGNFLVNWFNFYQHETGVIETTYIQYFQVQNNNGTIIYSDSTQDFQFYQDGLLGLVNGGFITCYWRDDTQKAYVQAFSESLTPQSEPQEFLLTDGIYQVDSFRVVELSNGIILITWKTHNKEFDYSFGLNLVSLTDGLIFSSMDLIPTEISDWMTLEIFPLKDGRFIIGWTETLAEQEKTSVVSQIFNADGSIHTDQFIVNDNPANSSRDLKLAVCDNSILAVWEEEIDPTTYLWKIKSRFIYIDGTKAKAEAQPHYFVVDHNYPNPFNAQTTIQFEIPSPGTVDLFIYNVSGRLVYCENSYYSASGIQSLNWNGSDTTQRPLPSGVYVVKLVFNDNSKQHYSSVQKIVLNR